MRARILVVDDVVDLGEILVEGLRAAGYDATYALPQNVLALVVRERFDVAIIDLGMPQLDGYQLARRLKDMPQSRALPLVALSGATRASDFERAKQAGYVAHMVKPAELDAIVATIERVLGASRAT